MKLGILLFILLVTINFGFGQIKSERQVYYWLDKDADEKGFHNNASIDSCIMFWEEYKLTGKVKKVYDFPADRCWQINGPWEHHYFYDYSNRIIEHRDFGGEEGEEMFLMKNYFYSYPDLKEQNEAIEILVVYDFKSRAKNKQKEIDTIYVDTINTNGMHDYFKTNWAFDTLKFDSGNFVFREDFMFEKELFHPRLIEELLNQETIKDFEIALVENAHKLDEKLQEVHSSENVYFLDFVFVEDNVDREIEINISKSFIDFEYRFINNNGDVGLTFHYKYYRNGDRLTKLGYLKTYIDYY